MNHTIIISLINITLESILSLAKTPERKSWLFLVRQLAVLLLQSIADNPE